MDSCEDVANGAMIVVFLAGIVGLIIGYLSGYIHGKDKGEGDE